MLRAIIADRGFASLYTGLGAASIRIIPMAFLSFGTYEALKGVIDEAVNRGTAGGGDDGGATGEGVETRDEARAGRMVAQVAAVPKK